MTLRENFELGIEESNVSAACSWTDRQINMVRNAIISVAKHKRHFTTDDVWELLEGKVPFGKGIAGQLVYCAKHRYIVNTGRTQFSTREKPHGHAQRLTVWRSLLT